MKAALILCLALSGCAKKEPSPTAGTPNQADRFAEVADRLPAFLDHGFIVSRRSGAAVNQGDSLLFTGLAVYGLDCTRGAAEVAALRAMLATGYYRFPGDKDPLSLDGLLGLYRGLAKRVVRCGDSFAGLPPVPGAALVPGFDYIRDLLAYRMGQAGSPSADRQTALELEIGAWAGSVVENHEAAYRVHLGLIALQTTEELGRPISDAGRNDFCAATQGVDIPTVDHWCGRADLGAWLDAFTYDVWQYRFQRSGAWEHPDGSGDQQPAVDYLVAYADQVGGT